MEQYAFLRRFPKLYNNHQEQVEGEKKGRLERVIRDCVNERKKAGKGFDG